MSAVFVLTLGVGLIIIMEASQLAVYTTKLNRLIAKHEREKKELRDKCHDRIKFWHKKYEDEKNQRGGK